jgi:hypothetical protein
MTDPNETSSLVHSPSEGWSRYPNLQLRPHSPNKGRGRLQVQIRRAFVGHRLLSSSQVYDWCFPRHRAYRRPMSEAVRWSVHRILRQIAEPICKVPPHNAWLWRLRDPAVQKPSEN